MAADRTDVGRRSTDDRALGIRIVGERVGRHAGAISSVEEASRAAEFTRADSGEKSHRRTSGSAGTLRDQDLRLGTGHRPGLGRPRPAGRPDRSKPMPCLPRETLKSRMMDHGSERRKVGPDGGVFHCYIAAYGHERPRRRRKPSVEGRAGPWEASGVHRCYVTFPGGGKGLNSSEQARRRPSPQPRQPPRRPSLCRRFVWRYPQQEMKPPTRSCEHALPYGT